MSEEKDNKVTSEEVVVPFEELSKDDQNKAVLKARLLADAETRDAHFKILMTPREENDIDMVSLLGDRIKEICGKFAMKVFLEDADIMFVADKKPVAQRFYINKFFREHALIGATLNLPEYSAFDIIIPADDYIDGSDWLKLVDSRILPIIKAQNLLEKIYNKD